MGDPWKRKEVIGGSFEVTIIGEQPVATIYAVRASEHDAPAYIGSTTRMLRDRIRGHILDAVNGSALPFHKWIMDRQQFSVDVLETVDVENRVEAEKRWIAHFPSLLNLTDGGRGLSGHHFAGSDHARRIGEKIKTSTPFVCEQCGGGFYRKLSQVVKGNCRFCSKICYQGWQRGRSKKVAA